MSTGPTPARVEFPRVSVAVLLFIIIKLSEQTMRLVIADENEIEQNNLTLEKRKPTRERNAQTCFNIHVMVFCDEGRSILLFSTKLIGVSMRPDFSVGNGWKKYSTYNIRIRLILIINGTRGCDTF